MGADSSADDFWSSGPSFTSFAAAGIARLLAYLLILWVSAIPVLAALLFVTVGTGAAIFVSGGVTILVSVFVLVRVILGYMNTSYELNGSTLTVASGSFNKSTRRVDCTRIDSIQLHRNALNNFFGTGTLEITLDKESFTIEHVEGPKKVLTMIEQETGERTQED